MRGDGEATEAKAGGRLTRRGVTGALAVLCALTALVAGPRVVAQPTGPIVSDRLLIQGTRLSIAPGDEAQVLDVAEVASVRTCFAGVCGAMAAGDVRVAGLVVLGELSGPDLPAPVTYSTVPGGVFVLPPLQFEGDYLLSNIRLARQGTGEVLGTSAPSAALLEVRQILLQSATVRQLSLADLQARGIQISQESFNALSFSVGFAFNGEQVSIELPVLFQGPGRVDLLEKPAVRLDGLSPETAALVSRWQPPRLVPFRLEKSGVAPIRSGQEEEEVPPEANLFGVIVLPGNVSFLNQFFDARLLVANGAPAGSEAVLANVNASVRLPAAVPREVLRIARTTPAVSAGQEVPVVGATGWNRLGPTEQGSASFTIEGLVPGTHVLSIAVGASLERPGRDPLPLSGALQAAVEVVDARFNLSFNHPDVVREGEPYTLFVTVTNLSRATQNLVTVALDEERITGAHKERSGDDFSPTVSSLAPGEAATLEFRLVADVTGRCVATTFQGSGPVEGVIRLRTGVGEAGIPLSPVSLVLPRFSELLPEPLLRSSVRLLGLAHGLAIAPQGAIPPELPRLVTADVERRAVDLAEAGQRLYLGDELFSSLEVLLLDQLGNRHDLAGFDQLRRVLSKGRDAAEALAEVLRSEQEARSLSARGLLGHFAGTASYARPWLAATFESAGAGEAPVLELRKLNGITGVTYLAHSAGDPRALRSLPFGEVLDVLDSSTGGRAPLAVVGRLSSEAGYAVVVHGPAAGAAMPVALSLLAPAPTGTGFVRVDYPPFAVPAGEAWAVEAVRAIGDPGPVAFELRHLATGAPVAGAPGPTVQAVGLPPFRVVGARQDFRLDPYGSGVWYLFNRPPSRADAEEGERYEVETSFRGLDTTASGTVLERSTTFRAASAHLQPSSERVVAVRFAMPVSAIVAAHDGLPVMTHSHRIVGAGIADTLGNTLGGPVPAIGIDEAHMGGLVEGRVVRGTGEPVPGAAVQLIRDRAVASSTGLDTQVVHDLVAELTTGADGRFFFPFVEEPILPVPRPPEMGSVQAGFRVRAIVPPGAGLLAVEEREEVASVIRLASRLARVNIAFLGRGTVTGSVLYDDGAPASGAAVTAASTIFTEARSAVAGPDGVFRIDGLPVGPITLSARDESGHATYATVSIDGTGDVAVSTLRLERSRQVPTGTVTGRVLVRREAGTGPLVEAAAGAAVTVYSSGAAFGHATIGASGLFRFAGVPAGRVTVQAADFSVSRTPSLVDLDLAADGSADVSLTLAASAPRAVAGRVLYRDPLSQSDLPVAGATVLVEGPGAYALTDSAGEYRIDGIPAQGDGEAPYVVRAIDFTRSVEGTTRVAVTDASPDPVPAATILLSGGAPGAIDGVVLDPLGRPAAGVAVTLLPIGETTTKGDGTFSFEDVPTGRYTVAAHRGTGLEPEAVGWIGEAPASVLLPGHRAFATIRLRGAGTVRVRTRTASAGVRSPVLYKPTWFSPKELVIRQKAAAIEASTDDEGRLTLMLPVGPIEVSASNPFHGTASYRGAIGFAGQQLDVDLVFEEASTVAGVVVDVDGVTPVPGFEVSLDAAGMLPQTQQTDPLGAFRFELVPPGGVAVTAHGWRGSTERRGRTYGRISEPGQVLELVVRLKPKGTVRGRVVEESAPGVRTPLVGAQFTLREDDFPNRRFPEAPGHAVAGSDGRFEVSGVSAGRITVVARDPGQVARQGSLHGEIRADFEVLDVGDVVLSGQVADLTVLVRDPTTGAPVPDAQVTLSNGEATVAGADGRASFAALPLGTWTLHAFHAPTGRGGRLSDVRLTTAGQPLEVVVLLDQRGRVSGKLFDDAARTAPIGGGTVRLQGTVNGRLWGASVSALASTSREAGSLGAFVFDGLPVASYSVVAGIEASDRQASESVTLTPTAPEADVALVLEPVREVWVRLFSKEQARGLVEVNPDPVAGDGVFSVSYGRLRDAGGNPVPLASRLAPDVPYPGHAYLFSGVLAARSFWVGASEASGEQRRTVVDSAAIASSGSGTKVDPYRVVLKARGLVRVSVRDAAGVPVGGASVRLHAANGTWEAAADGAGRAAFAAVEEGTVSVAAFLPGSPLGASASRTLRWDDEIVDVDLSLAPVVAASGIVYEPPADDASGGEPTSLTPAADVLVRIHPAAGDDQVLVTGADGTFRFGGLASGAYVLTAQSLDGEKIATASGALGNVHGTDYVLPPIVLDGARPRILTLAPPDGSASVSRTAPVEIVFSEPLSPAVLPAGASSPYFRLASAVATAPGAWSSSVDDDGRQVVRFLPSPRYENSTAYTLWIKGGPSGVRDREGRPLTDSGDVGTTFTTSDTDGPRVVGTAPSLARPVDPDVAIRVDFGEVLVLTSAQLEAAVVFEWKAASGTWTPFPVDVSLTRGGYSILVGQPHGVAFEADSLRRRLTVAGLTDAAGNPMPAWSAEYRVFDTTAPAVSVPLPAGAPSGDLAASATYILSPSPLLLDDVTPENPWGDLERVEYSFASLSDPDRPAPSPGAVVTSPPFAFAFVASYSGDGASPRPFPVWIRAFDTSGNASGEIRLEMRVVPNAPPTVGALDVAAASPVAGSFYAGSTIAATASGIGDDGDARITLVAELHRGPGGTGPLVAAAPARVVDRPPGGWSALGPQAFPFVLPLAEVEGSTLSVLVRATDARGASATQSTDFTVADDAGKPVASEVVARRLDGSAATSFFIGDTVAFDVRATDVQTGVRAVTVATTGGVFPVSIPAERVGATDVFRTSSFSVPASVSEPVAVSVTATVEDWGGNSASATAAIEIRPSLDPTRPVVEWLSPFVGGLWPASYSSVDPGKTGVDLLLRIRVTDRDVDGSGQEIPGAFVSVRVRGPADASGTLAADWVEARALTTAAGEWTYEAVWRVPNGVPEGASLLFEAEVVDSGANRVVESVALSSVVARHVYESATTAIGAGNDVPAAPGDEALPVFLLDGSTVSLYPRSDGGARVYQSLHLYSGGAWSDGPGSAVAVRRTVLTAPEVTSYSALEAFHPLSLAIGGILAIGHGAAIDVSGRGLLGGVARNGAVALPGERASVSGAAGSHAGMGHPVHGNWLPLLDDPGSVYGNIRDPRLPGGGGADRGAAGGGVVRIDAPEALVRLHGDVLANGGLLSGNFATGGAGGSVRLRVFRLEGQGEVRASGSRGSAGVAITGAGGGRVSISWAEPAVLSVSARADGAESAFWFGSAETSEQPRGGAGTVFLQRTGQDGLPLDRGTLRVANPSSSFPSAPTPLPGLGSATVTGVDVAARALTVASSDALGSIEGESVVVTVLPAGGGSASGFVFPVTSQGRSSGSAGSVDQVFTLVVEADPTSLGSISAALSGGAIVRAKARLRFASFEADGAVRVVSGDELEVAGVVDDRSAISIGPDARVLLGELPVIDFAGTSPAPGASVAQGSGLEVRFRVTDPLGISLIEEWSLDGTVSGKTYSEPLEVLSSPSRIQISIPVNQPAGPVTYRVRATDRAGRVGEASATWTVLPDTVRPTITELTLSPQRAGDTYVAGDTVTVTARATDDIRLASLRIEVAGQVVESAASPATLSWLIPPVATTTTYELVVTASDLAGNTEPARRTVTVTPRADAVAPGVAISCPSTGGLYPSGYTGFRLEATATDDKGIERVEILRGQEVEPVAVLRASVGTQTSFAVTTAAIPLPPVSEPTGVPFRVRAFDFGGNASQEVEVFVNVVPAVPLSATGPNDWAALETATAYLESGTLVLDQPRRFGGLLVLRGATVTHPAGAGNSVHLIVDGPLFVDCGGGIDVTARGYPAGTAYPGAGVSTSGGGSHLGAGGVWGSAVAATTYGSLTRPREAGSGSWGPSATAGAGVIRIQAGTLAFGGPTAKIVANGRSGSGSSGGAGGAIWLTTGTMTGDGLVEAAGGSAYYTNGGGGAVAIEYGTATGTALIRANAAGGGGRSTTANGGAGTVVLRGAGQEHGTLRIDNLGTVGQATALPSLGAGASLAGTGGSTLVTDRAEAIPGYFAGHWVEMTRGGRLLGTWRIGTISDRTVTLEANGADVPELLAGDLWQGVYRFDVIDVRGGIVPLSPDPIRDRLPTITVTSPLPGASFESGAAVPVTFTIADDKGGATVSLSLGGRTWNAQGANPTSAHAYAPWLGSTTALDLVVTVTDSSGNRVSKVVPLTVLAMPPLAVSIGEPVEGSDVWAGTTENVHVVVADGRPIRTATVTFGAESGTLTNVSGPEIVIPIRIPVVPADETRAFVARVEDETGAWGDSAPVTVQLRADPSPTVVASVDESSPVSVGESVAVSFEAAFRDVEGARLVLHVSGAVTYEDSVEAGVFGTRRPGGVSALDVTRYVTGWFPEFFIPAEARGPMRIVVTAIDGAGRTGSSEPIDLEVVQSPLTLSVVGPATVEPGGTLDLLLTAGNYTAPSKVDLTIDGAFAWAYPVRLPPSNTEIESVSRRFRIRVPRNALGEGTASFAAQLGETNEVSNVVTFNVVDATSPAVSRVRASDWALVSGSEVAFSADVSDDGIVQQVRYWVDGTPLPQVGSPVGLAEYRSPMYVLPATAQPRDLVVRVEATDAAGLVGSGERTFVLQPAGMPRVRLLSPSAGAMAVAGGIVPIAVEVAHARPIARVDFYREGEGTPFATRTGGGTEASYDVPPATAPESVVSFRVQVTDDVGAVASATASVRVVAGDALADGTTLAADDLSHRDRTVVVDGNVTISGQHRFARLLVLPGAALRHPPTIGPNAQNLDLEVTGDAYVARTGRIDTTGLGYEGGLQGTNAGFEGLTAPGLPPAWSGGSHGGDAEAGTGVYGSVRAPRLPGAGGGAMDVGIPGGAGGGAVALLVGGRLVVDGEIAADGASTTGGGAGAGGSILLDVGLLTGTGRVSARGGEPTIESGSDWNPGGGRVSVLGSLDDPAPALTAASGPSSWATGAPGTVFVKAPSDTEGHLVVAAEASEMPRETEIPGLGSGQVAPIEGRELGPESGYFRVPSYSGDEPLAPSCDVVGQDVEVLRDDVYVGRFLVESVDSGNRVVKLDDSAVGLLQSGDEFRSVLRFDSVNVLNRASFYAEASIEATFFLDPAASLSTSDGYLDAEDRAPNVWAGLDSAEAAAGSTLSLFVNGQDDLGLDRFELWIVGDVASPLVVPLVGGPTDVSQAVPFPVPATLSAGIHVLAVAAWDSSGQRSARAVPILVTADPGLGISLPAAGSVAPRPPRRPAAPVHRSIRRPAPVSGAGLSSRRQTETHPR